MVVARVCPGKGEGLGVGGGLPMVTRVSLYCLSMKGGGNNDWQQR